MKKNLNWQELLLIGGFHLKEVGESYNEHTSNEFLNITEWHRTFEVVVKSLRKLSISGKEIF